MVAVAFRRFRMPAPVPPKVTVFETVPIAPATVPVTVPVLIRSPPVKVLLFERMRSEVELSWITPPVTPVPMTEDIMTLPVPLPELVIVPVLFADVVEIVMPLAVLPLFLSVRLPVPVMPPETVMAPF